MFLFGEKITNLHVSCKACIQVYIELGGFYGTESKTDGADVKTKQQRKRAVSYTHLDVYKRQL